MRVCTSCLHSSPDQAERCVQCGSLLDSPIPRDKPVSTPNLGKDALEEELLPLLKGGEKIQAIKVYRERTGAGLKEAKDAVEAIVARHLIPPAQGCLSVVAMILPFLKNI